jgi:hypothetical protein
VLAAHVKVNASRPHILLWRSDDAHTAIELVACGRPLPRDEVRIVDEGATSCPSATRGACSSRGHRQRRGISATRRRPVACSTESGWRVAISPTWPKGTCTSPAAPRT